MSESLGSQLENDKSIDSRIDELAEQVGFYSKQIQGVRGPDPKKQAISDELVKKFGENRGRPLFYPYIGTGAGRGPYVELEDGSIKLDLINGIGIHIMGHQHPMVVKASIKAGLSDIVMQGNLQPNKEYGMLGQKLLDIAARNTRLKHVWVTTSGSMANENALKSCRQKNAPAQKILAMDAAFAGRTTMMAEVTDNENFKVGQPRYNEVLRVPFFDKNDPRSAERSFEKLKEHVAKHEGEICTFTFEPMQGEGGYKTAPKEYFLPMLEFCKQKKIAVWADEIQTFCRTGEFFAFEKLGFADYVDVCTVAKTIQNGATFYTDEYNPKPGLISGTFTGSTQSLKVGYEILEHLDTAGYIGKDGRIEQIHKEFVAMLNELNETTCKGLLQDAEGMGLMIAVTPLDGSKEKMMELLKVLYKNGLMTFGCGRGPFRLRFLLPAIIKAEDIQVAKKIIEKSILELA